jgi:anti-anti-sigma factor
MTLTRFGRSCDAAPSLKVSFHIEGPSTVVVARGEVDVASVPDLVDMLAWVFGKFDGPVVVDLAETEFMDTAAVRVLARARQFLGDYGRSLKLRSPPSQAAGLLRLVGLSDLVTLTRVVERDGRPTDPVEDPNGPARDRLLVQLARSAHPSSAAATPNGRPSSRNPAEVLSRVAHTAAVKVGRCR